MSKKLTLEKVHQICFNKSIEFLDAVYQNKNYKHNFKCLICGYKWKTRLGIISRQKDIGCKKCGFERMKEKNKLSLSEVEELCIKNNIIFLDTFYKNSGYNHNVKCIKCSYVWTSKINNISAGCGCPICAKENKKYSLSEVQEACLEKHIQFLDKNYFGSEVKHNVKCLICKHEWKSRMNHIRRNHGCPKCAIQKKKLSLDSVKNICLRYNMLFLDEKYISTNIKHNVKCLICNHEWKTKVNNILNDIGCPKCSQQRLTFEKVKEICAKNNIVFLDEEYKNNKYNHNVRCSVCLHEWKAAINNIQYNRCCPKCSLCKNEKITGQFLKELLDSKIELGKRFNISISNANKKYFVVDFYFQLNNQEYIVEYNGEQHYRPVCFGSQTEEEAEKCFQKQQIRDNFVRNYCKENNITLVEIDGRKYKGNKIKKYLLGVLNKGNNND